MPEAVLMFGDTMRYPHIRHALPMPMYHPIIYLEAGGPPLVVAAAMELTRLRTLPQISSEARDRFGFAEFSAAGLNEEQAFLEVLVRVCREFGVSDALVPPDFPVAAAELLAARDVHVHADAALFDNRRRVKSEYELQGMRRAQAAADAAMQAIHDALSDYDESLTAERLRLIARTQAGSDGQFLDIMQVLPGSQGAIAHIDGEGPIRQHESVIVDLGVRDGVSGVWADMTRTFCVGNPPPELAHMRDLCQHALQLATERVRPGVTGDELYAAVCDFFESEGFATERTITDGQPFTDGFYHGLGHGVGLEIHEAPKLNPNGAALVVGDVIAIEPGLYRGGFGGCRLEDLVLVTERGGEVLANFGYSLGPGAA
jgi:Xaa-Pro aminopeptidase